MYIKLNDLHSKISLCRCIGLWKRRFPVLSLKCRLKFENLQAVIIATAVLHNISRDMNLEDFEPEISIPDISIEDSLHNSNFSSEYTSERQHLINHVFNR